MLPVEGSELALTVFDDDELRVDPMEELVSGTLANLTRGRESEQLVGYFNFHKKTLCKAKLKARNFASPQ